MGAAPVSKTGGVRKGVGFESSVFRQTMEGEAAVAWPPVANRMGPQGSQFDSAVFRSRRRAYRVASRL